MGTFQAHEGVLAAKFERDRSSFALSQFAAFALTAGLVCFSILLPVIHISDDLPWLKVEQAALPFVLLGYVWFLMAGLARTIRPNAMWLIATAFSFCIAFSIWYGAEILRHPVLIRDFYEIPKAFLPAVFFTIGLEARLEQGALQKLWKCFAGVIAIVCAYAWAQFFNFGFTYALNSLYSGGEHIDNGLLMHGRVYSTMGNANVLGQLMTWAIAGFVLLFLFRIGNQLLNISLMLSCTITLAMTGSRYGLITTAAAIALALFLSVRTGRVRTANLAIFLLAVPLALGAFLATTRSNPGNTQRLASLRHPLEADSLRARLDSLWLDAEQDIAKSPLFGFGPAKVFYTGVFTDSEYLDVLKQFGFVGLLAYLMYYGYPLWCLVRGLNSRAARRRTMQPSSAISLVTTIFAFVVGITALAMNFGESSFYNQLLQAFVWLWLGIGVHCAASLQARVAILGVARRVIPVSANPLEPLRPSKATP
jgi:O-antigen ligase